MSTNINTTPIKKAARFISLQTKLIVGFTVIFTLVFASTYYWFYDFAYNEAMDQIKSGLYDTVNGATATGVLGENDSIQTINGNDMEALIKQGEIRSSDNLTDDPKYWEQIKILCDIRRIEPRAYPYTYIPGNKPNELIFITSWGWCLEGSTADDYATFKQPIEFSRVDANLAGLEKVVFQTNNGYCSPDESASCLPDISTDQYGSWVSAYAPIKNSEGKTVAGLGIDFKASYVKEVQSKIITTFIEVFIIAYVILLTLVYFVAQALTRPMAGLTKAAEQIGEGNYEVGIKYLSELKLSQQYPDEIETLQRVFNGMIDKVYRREQNLRKEVEQLKIQIDENRRKKQVEEIVESEFFQSLREKATEMRKRSKGGE
jgi:methyl-accepting chemotaxis protein